MDDDRARLGIGDQGPGDHHAVAEVGRIARAWFEVVVERDQAG